MPDNAAALTTLLLQERPSLVRRLQRMLGSEPAAEDVAQSLWFRVQKIGDHLPIDHPRAFLYRLASNLAIDYLRRGRSEAAIFSEEAPAVEIASDDPSPEKILIDSEMLEQMKAAFAELSPRCRQVLQMRRIEGKGVAEIAGMLGISRQMVWRHLNAAMDHISGRMVDMD